MQEKLINVMTWNIDWFRKGKRFNEIEDKYFEQDCDEQAFNGIVDNIKKFISNDNAIVFLNEVPHRTKSNNWELVEYHKKLCRLFPDTEYDAKFNDEYNNGYLTHCTWVISNNGRFIEDRYSLHNNRTIAVRVDDVTLLGVHMPTASRNASLERRKEVDKIWRELISYAKEKKEKHERLIILGDFNAYVGCKNQQVNDRFLELLKYTTDISPQDRLTFRDTTLIDHVLINDEIDKLSCTIEVEDGSEYSDHKYVKLYYNMIGDK